MKPIAPRRIFDGLKILKLQDFKIEKLKDKLSMMRPENKSVFNLSIFQFSNLPILNATKRKRLN